MRRLRIDIFAGLCVVFSGGIAHGAAADGVTSSGLQITVTNPTADDWKTVPVVVPAADGKALNVGQGPDGEKFTVQNDDLDGDGKIDEMIFLSSLRAGESKKFSLYAGDAGGVDAKPRAHAGMYAKTPQRRGFEGPGWESDMVGFRLYWDERNASDVFAKTTPTLSLEHLAQTNVDYHHLTPWGMDVLKVGTAVGIGGFGVWLDGKVVKVADAKRKFVVRADGPYRAVCDLVYTNWNAGDRELELMARMKICGGQDFADCDLTVAATDGKPLPKMICGYVKHTTETELIKDPSVAMVGRWGNQALGEGEVPMGGNLGLAVMADPSEVELIAADAVNDLIILKADGRASFRYMVDWYKDPNPAKSAKEFREMMRKTARKHPVVKVEGKSQPSAVQ